jgi:hypothetical protein
MPVTTLTGVGEMPESRRRGSDGARADPDMATDKTKLTELGTAIGLCCDPDLPWPRSVEELSIPGIPDDRWRPVVLPLTATAHPGRGLLQNAMANGCAFRAAVLRGRAPEDIHWTASARATWTSDVPRDLTVDRVYFIQAKYGSTCVLNTSPAAMVDHLLLEDGAGSHQSWYEAVALDHLQRYYAGVRGASPLGLPADVRDLESEHRGALKAWMRGAGDLATDPGDYRELCRAVSVETAWRWEHRLRASSRGQRTQMLFRMLRIAGGPYWLLGTSGNRPVRLAVADTRTWRERFELRRFTVAAAQVGQPQVDWRALVADRGTGEDLVVEGYCEIRWSHGKLQGNPECKVQVTTALERIPGYDPMT